jgi:hypothetical protein
LFYNGVCFLWGRNRDFECSLDICQAPNGSRITSIAVNISTEEALPIVDVKQLAHVIRILEIPGSILNAKLGYLDWGFSYMCE